MNVLEQSQQVRVGVDQYRVIPAFEQVPGGLNRLLCQSCIPGRDSLNQSPQRLVGHLQQEVQMVCHPAVRMQACRVPLQSLRHDLIQSSSVRITEEDCLPMVPAKGHVIEGVRNMQA
jgi:hypothetical protein